MAEKWERATDVRLIELWQAGLSIDRIAGQVGRTPSAVQSLASTLRLRRQPGDRSRYAPVTAEGKVYWTSADDDKLQALMKAKVGISDAALQLRRTPSAVETRWTVVEAGITPCPRRYETGKPQLHHLPWHLQQGAQDQFHVWSVQQLRHE